MNEALFWLNFEGYHFLVGNLHLFTLGTPRMKQRVAFLNPGPALQLYESVGVLLALYHQAFQVPRIEVFTYISGMDTAYVKGKTTPPK